MNEEPTITILDEEILVRYERLSTDQLKYFEENPRVYSSIYGENKPENNGELQSFIHTKMLEQQSVQKLIPEIRKHGGLLEPILVRYDTMQVIEGNSRLAAYRELYRKCKDEKWTEIPCHIVSKLSPEQQDAYLSQIHIKGKTPWQAYEKANFAYIRRKRGFSVDEIARRSSETKGEIEKRIKAVELMQENNDKDRSRFSYYDVLVRSRNINKENSYNDEVKNTLLSKIKNIGEGDSRDTDFTALDLREKIPDILKKKTQLKKFLHGDLTLDQAYQNARPSNPLRKVKDAKDKIVDITRIEISKLEINDLNALMQDIRRLFREVERIKFMSKKIKDEKAKNSNA